MERSICETLRSRIVEVSSAAENNFVANMVRLHKVTSIWIGLQDFAEEGHFVWSSSLQPPDYTHWVANEPNDAGGREDCVEIFGSGEWNDRPCDDFRCFTLCEQLAADEPVG